MAEKKETVVDQPSVEYVSLTSTIENQIKQIDEAIETAKKQIEDVKKVQAEAAERLAIIEKSLATYETSKQVYQGILDFTKQQTEAGKEVTL